MRRLLAFAALALFAGLAPAKNLYVNNSGTPACSDATTYAVNDASNPWCTVGRAAWGSTSYTAAVAAQAAAAGDTVLITAGTYTTDGRTTGTSCRNAVALNPANSGTAGSLITFQGQGTVTILLASGSYGPTIGADSRNYVVWDNIHIDEYTQAGLTCQDTGPVVVHDCTGCKILNSVVRGKTTTWLDNHTGIRVEAATAITISGNEIYNVNGAYGHNSAALMTYDTGNSTFEHNYIHDSTTGFYIKGDHLGDGWPQQNHVIRLNWFETISNKCIFSYTSNGSHIYQNVLKNCGGYAIRQLADAANASIVIANNLFVETSAAGVAGYSLDGTSTNFPDTLLVFNNIFYGPYAEAVNLGGQAIGDQSFEHNAYYGFVAHSSVSGAQRTFAVWRATYGQDSASPSGINSDPLFVSTGYQGYQLQAGSPARNIGVDILDLDGDSSTTDLINAGPYVTGSETIGPTVGGGSLLPGPGNVRWRPTAALWRLYLARMR